MVALDEEYGYPYHMTLDEYWAWREQQELRYEYVNGVVYAMAGASTSHNRVTMNLLGQFWTAAQDSDCFAWNSDQALLIEETQSVYYPDAMVTCPAGDDERFQTAPCLVVEVLSPSTQRADRTLKLGAYSTIPSLQRYLMISSDFDDQFVISHERIGDVWVHTQHKPTDRIVLTCPKMSFIVSDLYR